jgi:8-oxo-dGTP pyrophosphatase MutT (NUDIX family)
MNEHVESDDVIAYRQLPPDEWMKTLPTKRVGVQVLIVNDNGEFMLETTTYKKTLLLPGGIVESGEAPLEGAIREVKEELGIDFAQSDLRFLGNIYARRMDGVEADWLMFAYGIAAPKDFVFEASVTDREVAFADFYTIEKAAGKVDSFREEILPHMLDAYLEKTVFQLLLEDSK